ncbi:MAG: 2-C-methyl-D-erythritol 2,4-cyclodiphosphate synthase, partial [Spirochaetales bacterium]|nr:2-C-methyl-D-erythritol 2,4-cyclodiphosphate synthase [Spirochaetales bacterium]
MEILVGNGYDLHRLVSKRDFILGGIKVEYNKGFLAHSDGDVLFHALIDSLLGAL